MPTHQHLNTGADLALKGHAPVVNPFPSLGGRLYGAYLLGSAYGEFCADRSAKAYGHRYDWSGNNRHMHRQGGKDVGLWATPANASTLMDVPVTTNALLQSNRLTLVLVAKSVLTAKPVNAIRNNATDPLISLQLQPQQSSGRVQAFASDSGQSVSSLISLSSIIPLISMYAGVFGQTYRQAFAAGPSGAFQSAAADTTSRAIATNDRFQLLVDASTGTGDTLGISVAFYRGDVSADLLTIRDQHIRFLTAVGAVAALG